MRTMYSHSSLSPWKLYDLFTCEARFVKRAARLGVIRVLVKPEYAGMFLTIYNGYDAFINTAVKGARLPIEESLS